MSIFAGIYLRKIKRLKEEIRFHKNKIEELAEKNLINGKSSSLAWKRSMQLEEDNNRLRQALAGKEQKHIIIVRFEKDLNENKHH